MTIESEYYAKGQPTEGGFQAFLAKEYAGATMPPVQVTELRTAYFAGARFSLAGLMSDQPVPDPMDFFVAMEKELLPNRGEGQTS